MEYDALVVGGGVVGLAIARRLAQRGARVALLEAEPGLGRHASSRNSEVVHAGIYDPPSSLKAQCCLEGRARLLEYCAARGIRTAAIGKLIVACDSAEHDALLRISNNAAANGVRLQWRGGDEVARMEPAVRCSAALLSPTTAIVDSHGLLVALADDVRDAGGDIVLGCRFERASTVPHGLAVVAGGEQVTTRRLFIAAGAQSPQLARRVAGIRDAAIPTAHFARGHYFALRGGPRFGRLVYPVPVPGGLGIHVTLDLHGNARLGPDVQWIDASDGIDGLDYTVDPQLASRFGAAVRRFAPAVRDDALHPAHAGIRAKIVGPGEAAADFTILGADALGVEGVVALFGIESPGLTASLALAERAVAHAERSST